MVQKEASSRVTHGWDEYYCLGGQTHAGVKNFRHRLSFFGARSQKSLEHIAAVQQLCTRGPTGLIITHRQRLGPVQPFLKHSGLFHVSPIKAKRA